MGDMDGGLGGWKDRHLYIPYLKRGFKLFGSEC